MQAKALAKVNKDQNQATVYRKEGKIVTKEEKLANENDKLQAANREALN